MPDIDKQTLIALLDALRATLQQEPTSPPVAQALHQCERLHQAILQSHAEGLRFSSFTINRLMQQAGSSLQESTQVAARNLKEGLNAAGYGHQH